MRITTRNARFQQWQALLTNRTKRQRLGEFLVHGVRPITLAVQRQWDIRALLYDADRPRSRWASELLDGTGATTVAMAGELLRELGEKDETPPELVAVVGLPPDDLRRIPLDPPALAVVLDRPASPGNIGTLVRSVDAFGGSGVIVTGHAADVYDPKAVRASTGSLFAVPVVRVDSPGEVVDWARGHGLTVIGTDESGEVDLIDADLTAPTLLVIGNETVGLSTGWREACDRLVRIPMSGSASSLNAATAGSILLYEAARQRR
ncbi:MAG TPA: TrmH family RNA methyltransferase [Micromonosporaceae bacterium]|nr:TrmH family RNA methyltransferase [Micromonosporaceae bacterium]